MRVLSVLILVALLLTGVSVPTAEAQSGKASTASPARQTSSGPNVFTIRQHELQLAQGALTDQLTQVLRCIGLAQKNLRDIKGIVNRTAKADLVSCGRRLTIIQRNIAKLGKAAQTLSAQASAAAAMIDADLQAAGRARRLNYGQSQSTSED
ncbi:MAG: hypothetical protein V2B18_19240 [Pseudomonadota bacterium]